MTNVKGFIAAVFAFSIFPGNAHTIPVSPTVVTEADKVQWGYLNPLRGDKSPGAANLWGDRTKDGATGMLVRFNKGFSSPPHIHNISYRGVVIKGLMHNADPNAAQLWMPTGSFWTQPAGANHITAANGEENLIYLEIESGPYLVKPTEKQFDNGEQPINQHAANMVWQDKTQLRWINVKGVEATNLWGSTKMGEPGGTLIKLPSRFNGTLTTDAREFRAVVISGALNYNNGHVSKGKPLKPGSYFSAKGPCQHIIASDEQTLIYIRTDGRYEITGN